jgi:hypothetical protein
MLTPDEIKLLRAEFYKQLVGDERYSYPMTTPKFCIPEVEQRWQNYILENKDRIF